MKRYTVGQMAKSMGVSAQTLRHYEEMGLVESQRNEQNQYREFSMRDNKILMQTGLYRSMGFSLKEIRSLLKEYQVNEVQAAFNRRIDEVDEQIEALVQLKDELKEYAAYIQMAIERSGECWIEDTDKVFYGVLKKGSGLAIEGESIEELIRFQKMAPHIRQGFRVSLDRIIDEQEPFDFQYGVFLKQEWAEKHCHKDEIAPYKIELKGPIAHQIIKSSKFSADIFKPLLVYADEQGYKPTGDFYGIALYMNYVEEDQDYFDFILPLCAK